MQDSRRTAGDSTAHPNDAHRRTHGSGGAAAAHLGSRFEGIELELAALSELRAKPAANIRITTDEYAVEALLWPALRKLPSDYPDIKVEIVIDYGLTDIVAQHYDAGVRLGGMVAKDIIAGNADGV